VEVVLLAAVVACTAPEGHGVDELSTTQLVQLSEANLGESPEPENDEAQAVMKAAKEKVAAITVEETMANLRKARMTVVQGTTDSAKLKVLIKAAESDAHKKEAELQREKAKKTPDETILKRRVQSVADATAAVTELKSHLKMTGEEVKSAEATVAVDKEQAQATQKSASVQSFAEKKKEVMQTATAEADSIYKKAALKKKADDARVEADEQFNAFHMNKIRKAERTARDVQSKDAMKINVAQAGINMAASRVTRAKRKEASKLAQARAANFALAIGQRDETVAGQEKAQADTLGKEKAEALTKAKIDLVKGRNAIKQAHLMLEDNKLRISESLSKLETYEDALKDAKQEEALDQKKVLISKTTTDKLEQQATKLARKKDAVHKFGKTLKERAERDAAAAETGLKKAKADFSQAKRLYDVFTVKANNYQMRVDKTEGDRKKTVQLILDSIEKQDTGDAIKAGENHEGLMKVINADTHEKDEWDARAKGKLMMMDAARKEEKQAVDLQLLANKQMNQARNNNVILKRQSDTISELYDEQNERKAGAAKILSVAEAAVTAAEKNVADAKKEHQSRLAADRYIRDVKIAVSQEMIDNAKATIKAAGQGVRDELKIESVETKMLAKATKRADMAKSKADVARSSFKSSMHYLKEAEQSKSEEKAKAAQAEIRAASHRNLEKLQLAELKKEFADAKTKRQRGFATEALQSVLKRSARESANADDESKKLESKVGSLKHLKQLASKESKNVAIQNQYLASKDEFKQAREQHAKTVAGLDTTKLEIASAKQAYAKAFGKDTPIPGQDEEAGISDAISASKAVQESANAAALQHGID
jgi:hypothetical protein